MRSAARSGNSVNMRPLIQNGRYYRPTDPFKSEVCAWEIVGNSQEEVLLNVVMEEIHGNMTVNYVQLRGLDESALYKEQTTGRIYSGAALMHGGMPLPAEFGGSTELISIIL